MKAFLPNLTPKAYKLKPNSGFSTIEILVAMTILILCLTAVIVVASGSQSLLTDSQVSREALGLAQGLLEKAQADARKDFKLVNPSEADVTLPGGDLVYHEKLSVSTDPGADKLYLQKLVTAEVSWQGTFNRSQKVSLSAVVTNFNNVSGNDTCDSAIQPQDDWSTPNIAALDFDTLTGEGAVSISDIDAYGGRLYVTAQSRTNPDSHDFFIFDLSNPSSPTLIKSIDTLPGVAAGLNAVTVAKDFVSGKTWAFLATGRATHQLQVIDVTNPWSIPTPYISFKVPAHTGFGNSLFYKDNYLYLGTTTGGSELQIMNVPYLIANWSGPNASNARVGQVSLGGHQVNSVVVRNTYAYVATPNNQELKIYDITNPASPQPAGTFDAPGGSGNGKSLYTVGDSLFLGRTLGGNEFYWLNNTTPTATPGERSFVDLGSDSGISVNGLVVRTDLVFLLTNNQLIVARLSENPDSATVLSTQNLSGAASSGVSSLDCEGNYLYATANTSNQIFVISP